MVSAFRPGRVLPTMMPILMFLFMTIPLARLHRRRCDGDALVHCEPRADRRGPVQPRVFAGVALPGSRQLLSIHRHHQPQNRRELRADSASGELASAVLYVIVRSAG